MCFPQYVTFRLLGGVSMSGEQPRKFSLDVEGSIVMTGFPPDESSQFVLKIDGYASGRISLGHLSQGPGGNYEGRISLFPEITQQIFIKEIENGRPLSGAEIGVGEDFMTGTSTRGNTKGSEASSGVYEISSSGTTVLTLFNVRLRGYELATVNGELPLGKNDTIHWPGRAPIIFDMKEGIVPDPIVIEMRKK